MRLKWFGFILSGLVTFSSFAVASPFPTGNYDCSSTDWIVEVQIDDPGLGVPLLKVHLKDSKTETNISGVGMIFKFEANGKPASNSIRLPGTRWEAYFDQNGNLGLTEDHLNCKH